ncbi:unnamed protein product, partial [Prorocentrum cordatum]
HPWGEEEEEECEEARGRRQRPPSQRQGAKNCQRFVESMPRPAGEKWPPGRKTERTSSTAEIKTDASERHKADGRAQAIRGPVAVADRFPPHKPNAGTANA